MISRKIFVIFYFEDVLLPETLSDNEVDCPCVSMAGTAQHTILTGDTFSKILNMICLMS